MLDSAIVQQLNEVFKKLKSEMALVIERSDHPKQAELLEMLGDVAQTSDRITLREAESRADAPRFFIERAGEPVGIAFTGIPGGHEFTSLILAILNADAQGKLPDEAFIDRIRALRGPVALRTYVSLSCENCPEVVQALNLMAALHPELSHEMLDGAMVQGEIEALGIAGVPAVFLGDEMVSSGRASLADLVEKLEAKVGRSEASVERAPRELGARDVAVIGAGPAGASAAVYAARKGLSTIVLSDTIGGQVKDTLGIENFISVPYTEGPQLSAALAKHLGEYEIEVLEHRRVESLNPMEGGELEIRLSTQEALRAKSVVIATGANWRQLGVEGEGEYIGRGVAFCPTCDGPFYKGKDVLVVGGGNSGVEAAIDLAGIVKSVTVIEFLPQLKADEVLVKRLEGLPNAKFITNAKTTRILGDASKVTGLEYEDRASGERVQLETDGVFVQIGLVPNSGFLEGLVEMNRYKEIIIDDHGRTSLPGVYAAGDVTTVPYKQIVIAMGEGAKAALALHSDLF